MSARVRIAEARIRGVRGIGKPFTLPLSSSAVLVRGDNATAKSSMVQALRWALTGSMDSGASEPTPEQWQSHLHSNGSSEVVLSLVPKGQIVLRDARLVDAETTAEGHAAIDACKRSSPFLRREDLTALVNDAPGDRFKYLERFLELGAVDALVADLGEAAKANDQAAKTSGAQADVMLARLGASLSPPPKSLAELEAALWAEVERLGIAETGERGSLALVAERARTMEASEGARLRKTELHGALKKADALAPPEAPRRVLGALHQAEGQAVENGLERVLQTAIDAIQAHPEVSDCPVCEQTIEATKVLDNLRSRLALLADVRRFGDEALSLADEWELFLRDLRVLEHTANGATTAASATDAARGRDLLVQLDARSDLTLSVLSRLSAVRSELAAAHAAIPDEARAIEIGRVRSAVEAFVAARAELGDLEARRNERAHLSKKLGLVKKTVGDARTEVVDAAVSELSTLVEVYYRRIHPEADPAEITGPPSVKVKRTGAASGLAHIHGQFDGKPVKDPRYCYSDGHLDTVAVCFFLALRKTWAERNPDAIRLLILDDIVLSVDMGHARRLVQLIGEEFSDHQLVLLTHNEGFAQLCSKSLKNLVRHDVVGWTIEDGPRLSMHVSGLDFLRQTLESCGDAQRLARAGLPVVEGFMRDACRAYFVGMPYGADLTFGDYWPALSKKLKELSKLKVVPSLDAALEELWEPTFVRNSLAAHFQPWAGDVALEEVQRHVRGVLSLVSLLECKKCSSLAGLKNRFDTTAGLRCECAGGPTLNASGPNKDAAQ